MKCIDDEIPFEVPKSWEWCRLNSLADIVRGGSPRPAGSPEYYNGNIPFLKVADLTKDSYMYVSSYTATIKEAGLKKTRKVSANTLLLTNSGATLGVPKICTFETTFNDGIAAFLYLSEEIKQYLYWFLCAMTDIYRNINQGTAQPNLNTDIIKDTLLAVPPISEQRRIIKRIEELYPIIERYSLAQRRLLQLNADIYVNIKKSILYEAIQGRLVTQDATDEPASVLLQRIKEEKLRLVKEGKLKKKDVIDSVIFRGDDNKYFEKKGKVVVCIDEEIPYDIPNTWTWARLSDVAEIYTGNSISEAEKRAKYTNVVGRYYIGTKDVGFDHKVFYNNGVAIPKQHEQDFRIAPKDSILMCIEGGSAGRKIAIINQDVCFGNKLCCFSPYVEIGRYIYYYLQSPSFIDIFNENKTGIIGGVSIAKVKEILIPLPPQQEMERIVARIDELVASIMSR
jgi:type I restriction enzyme S subunit